MLLWRIEVWVNYHILGDHLRIDAVARLSGGSWYGEIITDALYLIDCISDLKYVDELNIGVAEYQLVEL